MSVAIILDQGGVAVMLSCKVSSAVKPGLFFRYPTQRGNRKKEPIGRKMLAQLLAQEITGSAKCSYVLDIYGAGTGIRTPDLLITNQLLYH